MKYCGRCGSQMDDNASFCSFCGADMTDGSMLRKRKKNRKGLKIALFSVLGILLAAAMIFAAVKIFPGRSGACAEKFSSIQKEFIMETLSSAESRTGSASDIDTDAVVNFELSGTSADELLNMITAELGIKNGLITVDVSIGGTTILSGAADRTDEGTVIACPALFDGSYLIGSEDAEDVLDALGISTDRLLLNTLPVSEINEMASEYLDIILSLANSKNTKKSTEEFVPAGLGESMECTVITCTPSADDYEKMLDNLFRTLLKDSRLETVCRMYGVVLASGGNSTDDIYSELISEIESDFENVKDIAETAAELGLRWEVLYRDDRICCIRIVDEYGQGIGYESFGEASETRSDAIVEYYGDGLADILVSSEYTLSGTRLTGNAVLAGRNYTAKYDIDTSSVSGLGLPYGSVSLETDGANLSLVTGEDGGGSISELSMRTADGKNYTVTVVTTDRTSSAQAPSGEPTVLDAANLSDFIAEIRSHLLALVFTLSY